MNTRVPAYTFSVALAAAIASDWRITAGSPVMGDDV